MIRFLQIAHAYYDLRKDAPYLALGGVLSNLSYKWQLSRQYTCWSFRCSWSSADRRLDLTHGFNSLRPRQNGRYKADDIFKCIFLNENVWFPTKISLKFVPKVPINNIQALVLIMAWRRPGDKPLSEPMMVSLPTHICVTRSQQVNVLGKDNCVTRRWNI